MKKKTKVPYKKSFRPAEKTQRMIEAFDEYWGEGLTLQEIADYFEVSPKTIYNHLDELASTSGVAREEILKQNVNRRAQIKTEDPIPFDYMTRDGILIEVDKSPTKEEILSKLSLYVSQACRILEKLDKEILASIAEVKALQ